MIYRLQAASGQVLTTWQEGDDIKKFNYDNEIICDETADRSIYHPIAIEVAEELAEQRDLAIAQEYANAEIVVLGDEFLSGATM